MSKYDVFSKINGSKFKIKTCENRRHAKKFVKKVLGVESGIKGFLLKKLGIKTSLKINLFIEKQN